MTLWSVICESFTSTHWLVHLYLPFHGQVVDKQSVGIFAQILLECFGHIQHGLSRAELRTLDHAFLVVDEQIGTAGQDVTALFRIKPGHAMLSEVWHKPIDKIAQIPSKKDVHIYRYLNYRTVCIKNNCFKTIHGKFWPLMKISGDSKNIIPFCYTTTVVSSQNWVHTITNNSTERTLRSSPNDYMLKSERFPADVPINSASSVMKSLWELNVLTFTWSFGTHDRKKSCLLRNRKIWPERLCGLMSSTVADLWAEKQKMWIVCRTHTRTDGRTPGKLDPFYQVICSKWPKNVNSFIIRFPLFILLVYLWVLSQNNGCICMNVVC